MQPLIKPSSFIYLITLAKLISSQSTTSLYVPGVSGNGGIEEGGSVLGSIVASQSGTTTWALALIQNNSSAVDFIPTTPTITFIQASATAHVFGEFQLDEQTNGTIDVQCSINGDVSQCTEINAELHGTSTFTSISGTFSEFPTPVPITVVSALPPSTPAPSPSSSSSLSASAPPPSAAPASSSTAPSSSTSPSSTTSGSSPTKTPDSSADYRIISVLLCAVPLVVVSMLL